jgi:tungstate transport system permease protein
LHDIADALAAAGSLVLSGDPALIGIVTLSLGVSLTAVLLASVLGLPFGAALAVRRFPGPGELAELLRAAGFGDVRWKTFAGGIVALHIGVAVA